MVDLVEAAVDHGAHVVRVAQVGDDEVIGLGLGVLVELQVDSTHPEALTLEAFHQMPADESAGAENEC